jgi:uncharacterized protein YbaP (TraB family)
MNKPKVSLLFLLVSILAGPVFSAPLYMWHISRGDTEMYLLGSIHILSEDFYPLPQLIEEISYRADLLVLEADVREGNAVNPEITQLIFENGYYHDGSGIEDHLPPETYRELAHHISTLRLPIAGISSMKPWLLAITLQLIELENFGFKTEYGLDQVLAKRHTGEIVELEGVTYQLNLLSDLSDNEQLELLKSALAESGKAAEYLELFSQAWKEGSPELLAEEIDADGDGLAEDITEKLIVERNINMSRKAADLLARIDGTILLVVGAAHFIGDEGIPALMMDMGYEVRQVMDDGSLIPIH